MTYFLWMVVTFTATSAGWFPESGTVSDLSSAGSIKELLHFTSATPHEYYFATQDWNIHNKQGREHIQLMGSGAHLSVRVVRGWDKCLQLACSSYVYNRLLDLSNLLFSRLFSYRQMEGYYIYHLRKILI